MERVKWVSFFVGGWLSVCPTASLSLCQFFSHLGRQCFVCWSVVFDLTAWSHKFKITDQHTYIVEVCQSVTPSFWTMLVSPQSSALSHLLPTCWSLDAKHKRWSDWWELTVSALLVWHLPSAHKVIERAAAAVGLRAFEVGPGRLCLTWFWHVGIIMTKTATESQKCSGCIKCVLVCDLGPHELEQ